jgi:hypothetical protein
MPVADRTLDILRHLAGRPGHDEVKADFRQLLVEEFGVAIGSLDFERRVPEVRGRIDALVGRTVFEAKSDLDREWADVERRMPDYLADRERDEGERFIGIASDGRKWAVFELQAGRLVKLGDRVLDPDRAEMFLAWLDGALALKASLPPDPLTIRAELGRESVAFGLVDRSLRSLWARIGSNPAVALKRQLWADLLRLVYGRDVQNDGLWFQHTFLVIVAKCVALAVMRLPEDDPDRLLSGAAFTDVGIDGAVESDFFDWPVADEEGRALVARVMAHVRRFRLSEVQSDVLKVLYESLIDRDERHGLGEYYTPDWLAAKVVREAVDRPLEQRVLDPACGSGTFLFHAVRRFLAESEDAGLEPARRAAEVCGHVAGTDIHPVAVIIARVTYILALAPALATRVGAVSIPVYLGDALQLSISQFMAGKELTIRVPPPPAGEGRSGEPDAQGREQLDFPETFCRDPGLFDKAIERMRSASQQGLTRQQVEAALFKITEQHYRADVTDEQKRAIEDLGKTYVTFDRLRREGRDTVWAYVARNLSRPLAFSAAGGWAQVLVGNPPWVAFRHMSEELQKRFRDLAKGERVHVGGKFATQNDLCALFVVRAVHLYLRASGRVAMVLPLAVLTRGQHEKLRSGSFQSVRVAWDAVWTMDDGVAPLFPVPSCVLFGRRRAVAQGVPATVRAYSGSLPMRDAPEDLADAMLAVREGAPALEVGRFTGGSPYRKAFRNGATLYPRVLCFVQLEQVGALGMDQAAPLVVSRRSSLDKAPWNEVPSLRTRIEREFIKKVVMGECLLPFRVLDPWSAVLPVSQDNKVLDANGAAELGFIHLNNWLQKVESTWIRLRKSSTRSFQERIDYHSELSIQFPLSTHRIFYVKSGITMNAARVRSDSIAENSVYWAGFETADEVLFLTSLLNSETVRSRSERFQARGQFGARHFDKVMFNLPIPRFDPNDGLHTDLAACAAEAEGVAAAVPLAESIRFQTARRLVREALADAGVAARIEGLVTRLLDGAAP